MRRTPRRGIVEAVSTMIPSMVVGGEMKRALRGHCGLMSRSQRGLEPLERRNRMSLHLADSPLAVQPLARASNLPVARPRDVDVTLPILPASDSERQTHFSPPSLSGTVTSRLQAEAVCIAFIHLTSPETHERFPPRWPQHIS